MIVICEECGKKVSINLEKMQKEGDLIECQVCNHVFTVSMPDDLAMATAKKVKEEKRSSARNPRIVPQKKDRLGPRGITIVIPREDPVVRNLNSYYLDIRKLLEHYQGEIGAGGIHFKSVFAEGVVFFDKDMILNAAFLDKDREVDGEEAIMHLMSDRDEFNFNIDIYEIRPEEVYFWANLSATEDIYENLFTDLEGLIRRMRSEKIAGYIDVSFGPGKEGGLLLFNHGEIIGGSFSWGKDGPEGLEKNLQLLIQRTEELGAVFRVRRISLKKES
ncbi:MAG: zinc-ribbon domain-containing protein [Thermodesulfobacteriota bacterium]|nr:zinc-ribbon domain-containing protein [Thermodesulfobacteriota bacterium]